MWLIAQLRSRIRYKIIGPFLVLALLTALFGSAIAFSLVANSWQERLINQLAATTRIANDTLVEQEATNLQFLRLIAFAGENTETGAPAIPQALAAHDTDGLQQAAEPFFSVGINDPNMQLDRLIIFDETGQTLVDMERPPHAGIGSQDYIAHASLNFSHVSFVNQVLASTPDDARDKFAGLVALPTADETLAIHLCTFVPIRSSDDTAVIGGAIMAMHLDSLLDILRQRSQAAIVTLYNPEGVPLASTILPGTMLTNLPQSYVGGDLRLPEGEAALAIPTNSAALPTPEGEEEKENGGEGNEQEEGTLSANNARQVLQIDKTNLEKLEEGTSPTILEDRPVIDTITIDERSYHIFYSSLVIHGSRIGVLSTGLSSDYVVRGWGDTRLPILGLTILVMAAIVVIGMITARQISTPLERLVATATTFVTGSSGQRRLDGTAIEKSEAAAEPEHKIWQDEIAVLSSSFERMTRNQRVLILKIVSESSQRAAILESIPDGIVVCDASGRIYSMNPATRRLLGLADDDDLPQHMHDVPLQPVTDPVFGAHHSDLYMLHEAVIRVTRSPIFVTNKTYVGDVYVLQDMTSEVNIDRARTNFTATISHEMRTPLTVMQGNAQLLLQGIAGTLEDQQQHMVRKIDYHARTMTRFLSNAILVAEIDSGAVNIAPKPTNLKEAVELAIQPLQRMIAEKAVALTIDIPDDLPPVLADAQTFGHIIDHLVHNACTYAETSTITIRAHQQGTYVQVDVCDSGCGIAPGLLERVFERFVRGEGTESNERAVRGSGLGLTIVKQLVELHGGTVWIESELEQGTTISFTLLHTAAQDARRTLPELAGETQADAASTNGITSHGTPIAAEFGSTTVPDPASSNGNERLPHFTIPTMMGAMADIFWDKNPAVRALHHSLHSVSLLPNQLRGIAPDDIRPRLERLAPHQFQRIVAELMPLLHQRWHIRTRPLPPLLSWAKQRFTTVLSADYVTVDALLRRMGLLDSSEPHLTAGRIAGLINTLSQLPHALWYEEHNRIYTDTLFYDRIADSLEQDMLLICAVDVQTCRFVERLTEQEVGLIIRSPLHIDSQVLQEVQNTAHLRDHVIKMKIRNKTCKQPVRLVEVLRQRTWHRYLTNISDPMRLPAEYVVALYDQHQGIDTVFSLVQKLLVQTHGELPQDLWKISPVGIQVQVWSVWALYAMLIDITDALAEQLQQPAGVIAPARVYRAVYHFGQHHELQQGEDPVISLATNAYDIGILKEQEPVLHSH